MEQGVEEGVMLADLEMQVLRGGGAGVAANPEAVALPDRLPFGDLDL
jgi:hypothetical protein